MLERKKDFRSLQVGLRIFFVEVDGESEVVKSFGFLSQLKVGTRAVIQNRGIVTIVEGIKFETFRELLKGFLVVARGEGVCSLLFYLFKFLQISPTLLEGDVVRVLVQGLTNVLLALIWILVVNK